MVHEGDVDFAFGDFAHVAGLYLKALALAEANVTQAELASFDQRYQDQPAELADSLVFLKDVVGNFFADLDEDLLGFDELLGVGVGVQDHGLFGGFFENGEHL